MLNILICDRPDKNGEKEIYSVTGLSEMSQSLPLNMEM
jgi:hypothetical protein